MTLTLIDFIGHGSFALTALSFYVRDMIMLRTLSVVAGLVGVAYNYLIPAGPLWLVIFWLSVFVAINVVRIANLLLERRGVSLNDEERELHETVFRNFSPVEFMKLMRLADWRDATVDEVLTEQGVALENLKLLYNGEVSIERDGAEINRTRDGTLIGEVSFIQGGTATATVRVTRPSRLVVWSKEAIKDLIRRNPTMDVAMKTVFSEDLTRKLAGKRHGPMPLPPPMEA